MPHRKETFELKKILWSVLAPSESPPKQTNVQTLLRYAKACDSIQPLWNVLQDEPILYSHEFSAWKFCHVLNQLLIEGHRDVLVSAYDNRRVLKNVGTYWKRSTLDIGLLILEYCKFLVRKVKFHAKYPLIAGDCTYDFKRLEKDYDLNTLCLETFHLLESVLTLQDAILVDVRKHRLSSTIPSGEVRVAPFVELLSDTKQLYKLAEKIMTKLHKTLPHESLCQLRKTFTDLFNGLHKFYDVVGRMAYFAQWDLASTLPTSEPVFVSDNRAFIFSDDTGSFASIELRESLQPPPYSSIRVEDPPQTSNLIDFEVEPTVSPQKEGFNTLLRRKDKKIHELEFQNERLFSFYNKEVNRMQSALTEVQCELVDVKTELKACHEEL